MTEVALQISIEAEGYSYNSQTIADVPIILSTDGTTVTVTTGRSMAPVSLTPYGWKQVTESIERLVEDARELSAKY